MKGKTYTVYKHISPSNKVYIGITSIDPKQRWNSGHGYKSNRHFTSAIKKYGWKNIKHDILFENLTEEEAKLMEQMYIALYDSTNREKGYNQTLGGESTSGLIPWNKGLKGIYSEETRKKMSEANKGKKAWNKGLKGEDNPLYGRHHSDEAKKKMSEIAKGRKVSTETRKKLSESHKGKISPNKGKTLSKEWRKKLSESHKGKTPSNMKKVYCITTDKVFNSITEAGKFYNINCSNIQRCCSKNRNYCGKLEDGTPLKWEYYE